MREPAPIRPRRSAARQAIAAIATLLQKEFDSDGDVAYTTQTDGAGAVAAETVSGLRDDLETRSSLLRGGGGGFRSFRAFGFVQGRLGEADSPGFGIERCLGVEGLGPGV
jgi:hypothetical protein